MLDQSSLSKNTQPMKNRMFIFILTAILSAPETTKAADAQGNITILSMGAASCGSVVIDHEKNGHSKLWNSIWVAGYLTAINSEVFAGENIASGTDTNARDLWIYNYCKSNPLHTLYRATAALHRELANRTK
jgi:hypothetical protein